MNCHGKLYMDFTLTLMLSFMLPKKYMIVCKNRPSSRKKGEES